jgi:hypothetical protein
MGKISTLGVLRLRAMKPSVCDRSVTRSAEDDDFVVSWEMQKTASSRTSIVRQTS